MQSKGQEYSKVFRRAGIAWGKGDIPQAIAILEEGITVAQARGDDDVVEVFQGDLQRYRALQSRPGEPSLPQNAH